MDNKAKNAEVKSDGRKIQVYRLQEGTPTSKHIWNIYLGDQISVSKLANNEHGETFTDDELKFI